MIVAPIQFRPWICIAAMRVRARELPALTTKCLRNGTHLSEEQQIFVLDAVLTQDSAIRERSGTLLKPKNRVNTRFFRHFRLDTEFHETR